MGIIFDSCIWLGIASGQIDRDTIKKLVGPKSVFTSVISIGELRFGIESCADPASRAVRAAYLRQIESRPVLTVTSDTATAFGILAAAVRHSGRSPRPRYNDLWLAAQAIEHGYSLMTLNTSDFSDLPGLQIVSIPIMTKIKNA